MNIAVQTKELLGTMAGQLVAAALPGMLLFARWSCWLKWPCMRILVEFRSCDSSHKTNCGVDGMPASCGA